MNWWGNSTIPTNFMCGYSTSNRQNVTFGDTNVTYDDNSLTYDGFYHHIAWYLKLFIYLNLIYNNWMVIILHMMLIISHLMVYWG